MDGGYNDVGVRFLVNFVSFNGTIYLLRGIEEGYSYGGNSFGGRIGFTPFNNPYILNTREIPTLDIGFSYIHDVNKGFSTTERIISADIESKIGPGIIRSEYIRRDKTVGIVYHGCHGTLGIDFDYFFSWPVIIYGRYGFYKMKRYKILSEENSLHRITFGININMLNISFLKVEYLHFISYYEEYSRDEYYSPNLFYLQLMITF